MAPREAPSLVALIRAMRVCCDHRFRAVLTALGNVADPTVHSGAGRREAGYGTTATGGAHHSHAGALVSSLFGPC